LLFCGTDGIDEATREALQALQRGPSPLKLVVLVSTDAAEVATVVEAELSGATVLHDAEGMARARYDATPGTLYLIRPDQHICARWRRLGAGSVEQALKRALCVAGTE
jgi:3-(3-hydroxy-phenyl)propionate hydroxylase